jgi:hypothetical protein
MRIHTSILRGYYNWEFNFTTLQSNAAATDYMPLN